MNWKQMKMETSQTQTTQSELRHKNEKEFRTFKANYGWKDCITITKKHRLENSQGGNGKKE